MLRKSLQFSNDKQGRNSQKLLPRKLNGNVQLHFLSTIERFATKKFQVMPLSIFLFKTTKLGRGGLPAHIDFQKTGKFQLEICFYVEMSLYDLCVNAP